MKAPPEPAAASPFRAYAPDECTDKDGYPPAWHAVLKHYVRIQAGHRCVRCLHPYRSGEAGPKGEWSPCDERCKHGMPARCELAPFESLGLHTTTGALIREAREQGYERAIDAQWRILTVHHLDGDKGNCRWFNLVALCQRCHLEIQGRVRMDRRWLKPHSEWFKPYVAGYYAWTLLGEDLPREQVEARLEELLALEDRQLALMDEARP